jgi:hypothetical protein
VCRCPGVTGVVQDRAAALLLTLLLGPGPAGFLYLRIMSASHGFALSVKAPRLVSLGAVDDDHRLLMAIREHLVGTLDRSSRHDMTPAD